MVDEPESRALRAWLQGGRRWTSSVILKVELLRAAARVGPGVVQAAREALERVVLIDLDETIVEDAATLPGAVRALDAIHVATARSAGALSALVTYDRRMAAAAGSAGLVVAAP